MGGECGVCSFDVASSPRGDEVDGEGWRREKGVL